MSTIKTETLSTPSNSTVPVDTVVNGTAKAWVNFDGTGTVAIRRAFNVSSITDNATGNYTVNFTTAMVDDSYSVNVTTSSDAASIVTAGISGTNSVVTTTSVRIVSWSTTAQVDRTVVSVSIFS